MKLYWDRHLSFEVIFGQAVECPKPSEEALHQMQYFTLALHQASRAQCYWQANSDFLVLLAPLEEQGWMRHAESPCLKVHEIEPNMDKLIRITTQDHRPYLFRGWTRQRGLKCSPLPRDHDLIQSNLPHSSPAQEGLNEQELAQSDCEKLEVFPLQHCTVGAVPINLARIGLLLPMILHEVHDMSAADTMIAALPCNVGLTNRIQVRAAITAPSAHRTTDYRHLKFIGACVLKFTTSCHVYFSHSNWPEGFLSRRRSVLVCNATLGNAVRRLSLDQYVINEPLDHHNGKIPCRRAEYKQPNISDKILASMAEALVGCSWIEGGVEAAQICTTFFLPSVSATSTLKAPDRNERPQYHERVEALIGYKFRDQALLIQALTHPSYAQISKTASYERLEFLGDAVLDLLVAELLSERTGSPTTSNDMTLARSALVNADLLGYLCLSLRFDESYRVIRTGEQDLIPEELNETRGLSLADFLRIHPTLAALRTNAKANFDFYESEVRYAMDHGQSHPWSLLNRLGLNKMFSDMIESIFGAIFVDSHQNLHSCRGFLQRLRLHSYACRFLHETISIVDSEKVE